MVWWRYGRFPGRSCWCVGHHLTTEMIALITTLVDLLKESVGLLRSILAELIEIRTARYQPPSHASLGPATLRPVDPLPVQLDFLVHTKAAAGFLGRSDRHLYRYREQGRLTFVKDDGQGRSGYRMSELRLLYFDLWGKWPD